MPNKIYRDKLIASFTEMFDNFQNSTNGINHNPLKGTFREYGIGDIIEKYLPKTYSIGKGLIVDNEGSQSAEVDLLIYDNNDISPILFREINGLFPIECCKYAFEIKSQSTANEIKTTIDKFNQLKSLKSINGSKPVTVYYAYSSDITLKDEFTRYTQYDSNYKTDPSIDVICISGKGYWYCWNRFEKINQCWNYIPSNDKHIESIALLSGILNTLNPKTSIGYYLLDPGFVKMVYFHFINLGIEITPDKIHYFHEFQRYQRENNYALEIDNILKCVNNRSTALILLKAFADEENINIERKKFYLERISDLVS